MNKLSINVRDWEISLKEWFGGTSWSVRKQYNIISGLNMDKLSMILKFQMVMMQ